MNDTTHIDYQPLNDIQIRLMDDYQNYYNNLPQDIIDNWVSKRDNAIKLDIWLHWLWDMYSSGVYTHDDYKWGILIRVPYND